MVDSGVDDGAALIVNRASVLHGNIKVLAATDAGRRYPVNMRRRSRSDYVLFTALLLQNKQILDACNTQPLSRTQQSVVGQLSPAPRTVRGMSAINPDADPSAACAPIHSAGWLGPEPRQHMGGTHYTASAPPWRPELVRCALTHTTSLRVASAATQPTNATGLTENAATRALIFTRPYTPRSHFRDFSQPSLGPPRH